MYVDLYCVFQSAFSFNQLSTFIYRKICHFLSKSAFGCQMIMDRGRWNVLKILKSEGLETDQVAGQEKDNTSYMVSSSR